MMRPILLLLLSLALAYCAPALAQDLSASEGPVPPAACDPAGPETVVVEAGTVEGIGSVLRASGGVRFIRGPQRLTASEVVYDTSTETGSLREVTLTTCAGDPPEFSLRAREVQLRSRNRIRAKGASLYLGKFRVLTLPSVLMRVGGNRATAFILPTVGYDNRDGITLSQTLRLVDEDRTQAEADLSLTTRHSIQGELTAYYGMDGPLIEPPGRQVNFDRLRYRTVEMPLEAPGTECDAGSLRAIQGARLRTIGRFTLRQRTYDVGNEGLVVFRQPEVGVDYVGRQINLTRQELDPRLEIYPELIATWGRYKETPGTVGFSTRTNITALGAINLLSLGPRTSVQPVASYGISSYGTDDTFRTWSYALDASHLFTNGSSATARYTRRGQSGVTPFEFDNIDVRKELQGAFQVRAGQHVFGFSTSYDFDRASLYEWIVLYGHRSDCLAKSIRWNNRLKRLSVHIRLVSR